MKRIFVHISLILIVSFLLNYSTVLANEIENISNEDIEATTVEINDENNEKEIEENTTNPIIKPGNYEIYIKLNDSMVVDIQDVSTNNGANAQIYERTNAINQKFKIILNNDGTYTFLAIHSNKVLDIAGAGMTNGTNVWQYEANGTDAQKWIIQDAGNGYYNIVSKLNGLYLDITGGSASNCQNIQVYEGNRTDAQKFKFSKILNEQGNKTIENGIYKIYSQVTKNRVLEIPNSNTSNSILFKTAENNNKANQKFKISYNNDGTYTIEVMHSAKAMDVRSAGRTNSTPVQQYESNRNRSTKVDYNCK